MELLKPGALALEHFSDKPLVGKPIINSKNNCDGMKPAGLWVSVAGEHGWPEWCQAEDFRVDRLLVRTPVEVNPGAKILHIDGEGQFDQFTKKWATCLPYPFARECWPDWELLKKEYDGVVISPYLWNRRMGNLWYYGWDCASGCIWNTKAIKLGVPDVDPARCTRVHYSVD